MRWTKNEQRIVSWLILEGWSRRELRHCSHRKQDGPKRTRRFQGGWEWHAGLKKRGAGWLRVGGQVPSLAISKSNEQEDSRFDIVGILKMLRSVCVEKALKDFPVVLEVILFTELRLARKRDRCSTSRHLITSKSFVIEVETREKDDVVYCVSKERSCYPAVHRYLCKSWQKFDRLSIRCIRKSRQDIKHCH